MDTSYRAAKGNRCIGINGVSGLSSLSADIVGVPANSVVENKDLGSTSTNIISKIWFQYEMAVAYAFFNSSSTSG